VHTASVQPAIAAGMVGTLLLSTELVSTPPTHTCVWHVPTAGVTPGVGVPSDTLV
jgi:hypothetical protein